MSKLLGFAMLAVGLILLMPLPAVVLTDHTYAIGLSSVGLVVVLSSALIGLGLLTAGFRLTRRRGRG